MADKGMLSRPEVIEKQRELIERLQRDGVLR